MHAARYRTQHRPTEKSDTNRETTFNGMKVTSLLIKRWQAEIKNCKSAIDTSRLNAADASHQFAPEVPETATDKDLYELVLKSSSL